MPTKQSGKPVPGKKGKKTISRNRVAHHDYEILDTYEAGIELTGTEVKSLRERASQINDSFCIIRKGEVWWVGAHIHPYSNGGVWNVDPDRRRKLLLHRLQAAGQGKHLAGHVVQVGLGAEEGILNAIDLLVQTLYLRLRRLPGCIRKSGGQALQRSFSGLQGGGAVCKLSCSLLLLGAEVFRLRLLLRAQLLRAMEGFLMGLGCLQLG